MAGFPPVGGGGSGGLQLFTERPSGDSGIYADFAERDAYFGASQSETDRVAEDQSLVIKVLDDGTGTIVYQQYLGTVGDPYDSNNWSDTTGLVQGENGAALSNLPAGTVAVSDGNEYTAQGIHVDQTTFSTIFDNTIEVPQASIKISDPLSISEATNELIVRDTVTGTNVVGVQSVISDPDGTSPLFLQRLSSLRTVIAQPDFSTTLTDNPLVVPLVSSRANQTDAITIKVASEMTNFRARAVDNVSGVPLKYIPSKAVWESGKGGLTLPAGDYTFNLNSDDPDTANQANLGFTPWRQGLGQTSTLTAEADNIAILGAPIGIPYFENQIHFIEPIGVPNTEDVTAVADAYLRLNDEYTTASATNGGLVVNYLPTATTDTVTDKLFVSGVAATSNPTVETDGSATFTTGDIIQLSGGVFNNGWYEVESHTGTTLTIRGVGTVDTVEGFTKRDFIDTSESVTITKINVAVLRASDDGDFQTGKGSTTGITFTDIPTVPTSTTALSIPYFSDSDGTLAGDSILKYITSGINNFLEFDHDDAFQTSGLRFNKQTGGVEASIIYDENGNDIEILNVGGSIILDAIFITNEITNAGGNFLFDSVAPGTNRFVRWQTTGSNGGTVDQYVSSAIPTTQGSNGDFWFYDNTAADIYLKRNGSWAGIFDSIESADTWAEVLANGNTTGGTNAVISSTDSLTTDGSHTTQAPIDLSNLDALTTGNAIDIVSNSNDFSSRSLINIENQNSAAVGVTMLNINNSAGGNTTDVVVRNDVISIGKLAEFVSNSTDSSSRSLVLIENENELATGAVPLNVITRVDNGEAINIVGNVDLNSQATTAIALDVSGDSLTTGKLAYFYSNSDSTSPRKLVEVVQDSALASGTQNVFSRNDAIGGVAFHGFGRNIFETISGDTANTALLVIGQDLTTGLVSSFNGPELTTGQLMRLYSNSADTSIRKLVEITNDNALATGATCLNIIQDANRAALEIAGNGNLEQPTARIIGQNTGGNVLALSGDQLTGGALLRAVSNSNDTSQRGLVFIQNQNAAATNAYPLWLSQLADSKALYIPNTGTATDTVIDVIADNLTTGSIASFYSNSADTSTRNLVEIINDNPAATGTTCLSLRNDAGGNALEITTGNIELDDGAFITDNGFFTYKYNFSFNPSTTSTLYTQYIGTYDVRSGPITIKLRDNGVNHGSSSQFLVTRFFAATPIVHVQNDGLRFANYTIYWRSINSTTYELFWGTSATDNATIAYQVTTTADFGATSNTISASNDTNIFEATRTLVTNRSRRVGVGIIPVSAFHVYQNDTETGNAAGITIEQDGDGDALLQFLLTSSTRWVMGIDNSFNDTFRISPTAELSSNPVFEIATNGATSVNSTATTGNSFNVISSSLTTGSAAVFYSNSSDISARNLVEITNDNVSAVGATALSIQQDANARSLLISANGNTTSNAMEVIASNLTTGRLASFYSNSSENSSRNLIEITNDNASANGTTAIFINQDANGRAIFIDTEATSNDAVIISAANQVTGTVFNLFGLNSLDGGNGIYVQSNSAGTGNNYLFRSELGAATSAGSAAVLAVSLGAGTAIQAQGRSTFTALSATDTLADFNGDVLTTGSIASFNSNSSDTSVRNLVEIINDNSAALNALPLFVRQDADHEAVLIDGAGIETDIALEVNADALTNGEVARFYSNSASTTSRNLVRMWNANSAATNADVLFVDQDADAKAINVFTATATDEAINLSANSLTTGKGINATSNSSAGSSYRVANFEVTSGGTGTALRASHANGGIALLVQGTGARTIFQSSMEYSLTTVGASTYNVGGSDALIIVDYTATAPCTITIPSAQRRQGRRISIKDSGGNAGTNNVTIATGGSETIDGAATAVLSTDYESVDLICNGTNWFII